MNLLVGNRTFEGEKSQYPNDMATDYIDYSFHFFSNCAVFIGLIVVSVSTFLKWYMYTVHSFNDNSPEWLNLVLSFLQEASNLCTLP